MSEKAGRGFESRSGHEDVCREWEFLTILNRKKEQLALDTLYITLEEVDTNPH